MKVPESNKLNVNNVINRYGRCLELVPIDPNFHNISVGLYAKDQIATVWTFSHKKGVEERIRQIRDQLATLGDLQPVNGTHNQLQPHCGDIHQRDEALSTTRGGYDGESRGSQQGLSHHPVHITRAHDIVGVDHPCACLLNQSLCLELGLSIGTGCAL